MPIPSKTNSAFLRAAGSLPANPWSMRIFRPLPIDNVATRLKEMGKVDDAKLKEIDREVRAIVTEAAEFAQNNPEPDTSELYTDVLIEA